MYKLGFKLGDPSCDGHGITEEFHILTSHSVEEIKNAYNKATEKLGWNYLKCICHNYEDNSIDLELVKEINEKLGLKIEDNLDKWHLKNLERDGYCYLDSESFVAIFFDIVTSEIPNFEWKERDMEESELHCLNGAGYGLFSH